MRKTSESAAIEELLEREFPTKEERAQFKRDVALKVSSAELIRALDQVRETKGITKTEIAERIGTARSAVSRLLGGGTSNTNVQTLAQVADAMDVYLDVKIRPQPREKRKRRPSIEVATSSVRASAK